MRILYITNTSSQRCGVQAYGEEWVASLRRLGLTVDVWDGTYSRVKALDRWIPENAATYDVIHFNWDPQTINHYLPQHFDGLEDRLSLFLHDVPPNSTCPVHGIARWIWAFEPGERITVLPEPVPPTPYLLPQRFGGIGVSGVRKDPGHGQVADLCRENDWYYNAPLWWDGAGPWLSNADEIRRLATSDVNVCWYHTSGRGKSMAAMFCVAAGRPLVLSHSTMFSALAPYGRAEGIYHADSTSPWALTDAVARALSAAARGQQIAPRIAQDLGWDTILRSVIATWRTA